MSRPYVLTWSDDTATENWTGNGALATLYFKLSESAAEGSYPVAVSYQTDCAESDANVLCAFYTDSGRMAGVYIRPAQQGSASYAFPVTGGTYAKIFVLDSLMRPLCESRQISIS